MTPPGFRIFSEKGNATLFLGRAAGESTFDPRMRDTIAGGRRRILSHVREADILARR